MDTKYCRSCDQTKPLNEFNTRVVNKKRYPTSYCRLCRNKKRRDNISSGLWKSSCQMPSSQQSKANEKQKRTDKEHIGRFILTDSRRSDKKKGLVNDLTRDVVDNLINNPCSYCGATDIRMTLDRVDNDLGHIESNVIPSCYRCNIVRGSMPYAAWCVVAPAMKLAYEKGLFGDWRMKPVSRKEE